MKQGFVFKLILCFCLCTSFYSCKKKICSEKEFTDWINDKDNGCVITKDVNGVTLSVFYLPNEYVTVKELKSIAGHGKATYDSLLNYNKYNLHFLMIFKSSNKTGKNDDVMYKGITNLQEYSERTMTLNFAMEQDVELKTKNAAYQPVLTSLENTYGLSKDIKINLLFSPISSKEELLNAADFDFIYNDENFDMGTVHCVFDKKEIENKLPEFQEK